MNLQVKQREEDVDDQSHSGMGHGQLTVEKLQTASKVADKDLGVSSPVRLSQMSRLVCSPATALLTVDQSTL